MAWETKTCVRQEEQKWREWQGGASRRGLVVCTRTAGVPGRGGMQAERARSPGLPGVSQCAVLTQEGVCVLGKLGAVAAREGGQGQNLRPGPSQEEGGGQEEKQVGKHDPAACGEAGSPESQRGLGGQSLISRAKGPAWREDPAEALAGRYSTGNTKDNCAAKRGGIVSAHLGHQR